ncbi:MAG: MGMT family protein [Candidatus Hadarchaeia archaeon]
MEFKKKVLEKISEIPRGKVSTYKQIARAVGSPKASRAVGNVLAENPKPEKFPCHRVVRSDGRLGGYSGRRNKESLLREEGVKVRDGKVDLDRFGVSI